MSFHWIRNVLIDGEQSSLDIQIGNRQMSDKCYIKVGKASECWFKPTGESRDEIVKQGIKLLQKQLKGKIITTKNGEQFNWE